MDHFSGPHHVVGARRAQLFGESPRTDALGVQTFTISELRDSVDRFADMLRAADKKHATIASYVTQAERFLNWLEGGYKPRTHRTSSPYGWQVSEESKSKYRPLRDYLRDCDANAVRLTFRQIEQIINAKLPRSAYTYSQWWANDRTGNHTQAYAWLSADRKVVQLDISRTMVMFVYAARNPRPAAAATFG